MNRQNHRPSDQQDSPSLAELRRRFNKLLDEEIAYVFAQDRFATCDAVARRVEERLAKRNSILTATLKAAFITAEIRARVSRRLKHAVNGAPRPEDQPPESEWFSGMDEWILPERLTWEDEKGRVVYCEWFDSFKADRKAARAYKKQCMDADAVSFSDYCAKDDRADVLVAEFGDLPLRELIQRDCERRQRNESAG